MKWAEKRQCYMEGTQIYLAVKCKDLPHFTFCELTLMQRVKHHGARDELLRWL